MSPPPASDTLNRGPAAQRGRLRRVPPEGAAVLMSPIEPKAASALRFKPQEEGLRTSDPELFLLRFWVLRGQHAAAEGKLRGKPSGSGILSIKS
jgi:hypothetical protein